MKLPLNWVGTVSKSALLQGQTIGLAASKEAAVPGFIELSRACQKKKNTHIDLGPL